MKKRLKLKKEPIIILVIILILFVLLIISCSKSKSKEEVEVFKKQTSFIESFTNSTNEGIDEKTKKKIIDFFDIYYLSMKELNEYDMRYLFNDEVSSYINQAAMHFLVNYRLLNRNDLKLDKVKYSLNISKITKTEDEMKVLVLEDSIFNFSFMSNIESKTYNVENTFTFKKDNNEYKLVKYDKNADFYNLIKNDISETSTIEDIKKIADDALIDASSMIDNDNNYYENIKTIPVKKCDHKYDRDAATAYALSWITTRNPEYASFDNYGGNCQNYASQVLRSGGIPNDVGGFYRFKYYDSIPDETTNSVGRTPSWAGVSQFYSYAKYNQNASGLCSTVDINYYYGDKGDLVQFGYKDIWAHTSIITGSVVENGKVIDLLTSSNTTDRENFPLSAYNYPNRRLIKIYGWND